jgi:hypothetical protein
MTFRWCALLALTLLTVAAPAQNLVVNGSFTGNAASFVTWPGYVGSGSNPTNVPGWTQVAGSAGGYGVNGAGAATSVFGPANSGGNTFLFIQGTGKELMQTLPGLTTNANYVLTYKAAARNQTGETNDTFMAQVGDGASVFVSSGSVVASNTAFQSYSYYFTTPGSFSGTPSLRLYNVSGSGDHTVDFTALSLQTNSNLPSLTVFLPTSGNWNAAANWSGGTVPGTNQSPDILNGCAATVDSDVGTCGSIFVGQGSQTPTGTVLFRPGAALTAAYLYLGRDGANFGRFAQSGGALTVNGDVSVGDAAGGGTGASGEFDLSAGTLRLSGPGSTLWVGNQGVGRMVVAGNSVLSVPTVTIGAATGSSGSKLFQWGGSICAGSLTVGAAGVTNSSFTLVSGMTLWTGLLQVNGQLALQGSQFLLQQTNSGGGLRLGSGATLEFDLDAIGVSPVTLANSRIFIDPGSKLVVDGSKYSRWGGQPGTFTLVQHCGYSGASQFTPDNITLTGFVDLAAAVSFNSNSIVLVVTTATNSAARVGQGLLCEYWEVPITVNPGVSGRSISAPLSALPDYTNTLVATHPVLGCVVANFDLSPRLRDTNYFMRYSGFISVPTNGSYTFYANSDEGSKLWLDGVLLVNNDGAHSAQEAAGTTNLTAGPHALTVGYFQNTGSQVLTVSWAGPTFAKQAIPDSALWLAPQPNTAVRQPVYRNVVKDSEAPYNYAPSFMYDEVEGLYKIWMCGSGISGAVGGDNILYREATSLEGLLSAPLTVALQPSLDPTKFDQIHACDPNVYRVGDLLYLAYGGNTDGSQLLATTRLGMAISYDGGRSFQRLNNGDAILSPNLATLDPNAYGIGQPAVAQAPDGYYYMIYTDMNGNGVPAYQRVIRSLDPAFTPGSFTNVVSILGSSIGGSSLDLAFDDTLGQFVVINGLTLIYYNTNWTEVRRVARTNPFDWSLGEGHGLLTDSRRRPINYNQDGVPSYVIAASTVDSTNDTSLWAEWVAGDLKYLVLPQTQTPSPGLPRVLSAGYSFSGSSTSLVAGSASPLSLSNNFTVDFWARPAADATLLTEASSGTAGTTGQRRMLVAPDQGDTAWGAGHAGLGIEVALNGVEVIENAASFAPCVLSWPTEINDWVHVTVVCSNGVPLLYLDARYVHAGLAGAKSFVHPSIGTFGGNGWGCFSGRAWNYRVWNRVLSPAEISLLPGDTAETSLAMALAGKWLQDPPLDKSSGAGTPVLNAAAAGLFPGATLSWSLTDTAGGAFAINPGSGLVTVANPALLNFSTPANLPFTVQAAGSQGQPVRRTFSVLVTVINHAPVFSTIPNATIVAGYTLQVPAAGYVADTDLPPQSLTFSLVSAPTNALLDPASGLFAWRPLLSQAPITTSVRLAATDNGNPPMSATQRFWVTVNKPAAPTLTTAGISNSSVQLTVAGDAGPDYTILGSTNLVSWDPLWTNYSAMPPFQFADPGATNFSRRFYHVRLGP